MLKHCNPPKSSSRFFGIGTIALFCLIASVANAAEKSDPRWNYKGWTPSLALSLGVHVSEVSGYVIAVDGAGDPIRTPNAGDDNVVTPLAQISLGIETPELPKIPGKLRLFGSVDYFVTFPADRKIASEGSPTGFFVRPGFANPPEAAIEGQGSSTEIETKRSAFGFTGGIAIPIEIAGVRFSLKPGVAWMRYAWDIEGLVLRAVKPESLVGRDFRGVELRAKGKLYSNGVGPYLAVEFEPDDWGPVLVSAFFEAAYYRTLGDRDANISDTQSYAGDGVPPDTYTAAWGIEVDEQFWRAAVGIRIYLAAD